MRSILRRRLSAGAILCYHALTDGEAPSASVVNVPADRLAADLHTLSQWAEIVPLLELLQRHRSGRSCAGLAAVTFDDAYHTVLRLAFPLLERHGIPATVFATCEAMETGTPFWWDRVEDLHARLPESRWLEFEDKLRLPDSYRSGQPVELGRLRPLRQWILAKFAGRWPSSSVRDLEELERESDCRTLQRCMTPEELDRLVASPLISLGIHTWSHPVMPLLDREEQRQEIRRCMSRLRERHSEVIPVLAFPYGLYDQQSVRLAQEEGMVASLSLTERTLRGAPGTGVLPRICGTRDLRSWKLGLRLTGWFDDRVQRSRGLAGDYPALPSPTT